MVNGEAFHVPVTGVHKLTCTCGSYKTCPCGSHEIFAWRRGMCLMLVGSSRLALQHCHDRIDVWAHPSLAGSLHGLCGHYNFYVKDDFTDRTGQVHPLAKWPQEAFPMSWRVSL